MNRALLAMWGIAAAGFAAGVGTLAWLLSDSLEEGSTMLDGTSGRTQREISGIIVHHSGASESAWPWDAIVLDHTSETYEWKGKTQTGRNWTAVGYHYGIGEDGTVYDGRSLDEVGAHAYGANTGTIGVCLLGNFAGTNPPDAQLQAAVKLISQLMADYGIAETDVQGHREVSQPDRPTVCPGFSPSWFREQLTAYRGEVV